MEEMELESLNRESEARTLGKSYRRKSNRCRSLCSIFAILSMCAVSALIIGKTSIDAQSEIEETNSTHRAIRRVSPVMTQCKLAKFGSDSVPSMMDNKFIDESYTSDQCGTTFGLNNTDNVIHLFEKPDRGISVPKQDHSLFVFLTRVNSKLQKDGITVRFSLDYKGVNNTMVVLWHSKKEHLLTIDPIFGQALGFETNMYSEGVHYAKRPLSVELYDKIQHGAMVISFFQSSSAISKSVNEPLFYNLDNLILNVNTALMPLHVTFHYEGNMLRYINGGSTVIIKFPDIISRALQVPTTNWLKNIVEGGLIQNGCVTTDNSNPEFTVNNNKVKQVVKRSPPTHLASLGTHIKVVKRHAPCYLVVNEFKHGFTFKDGKTFVELVKSCPIGKVNVDNSMEGYYLVFIRSETKSIVSVVDLSMEVLLLNSEFPHGVLTVGSYLDPQIQKQGLDNRIPNYSENAAVMMLVHFNDYDRKRNTHRRVIESSVDPGSATPDNILTIIKDRIVDILVYGASCDEECQLFVQKVLPPFDTNIHLMPLASTDIAHMEENVDSSMSQCLKPLKPFSPTGFLFAKPTPSGSNACPALAECTVVPLSFPFNFRGTPLQRTAQRMLINLHYYFTKQGNPSSCSKVPPSEAVARCLNLSKCFVRRILKKHAEDNVLVTPGHKRPRSGSVRGNIDNFDTMVIRNIITGYYAQNLAPLFDNIYVDFIRSKPTGYKCSKKTFRKVLRSLGYRYKKIDNRAVLVQRPDVVMKRGKYLRALMANAKAGDSERELIYLDETWIDTNARTSKGWLPRQFLKYQDKVAFAYANQRAPSSPRLIVLAAADSTGILKEAIEVYAVKKGKASENYHDNVNSEKFMCCFKNLLEVLATKPKKYIIVMDNASYHSSSTAPTLNSRKADLYEWLKANEDKIPGQLRDFEDMRVWELKRITRSLKQKENFFRIDALAEEKGQVVPPWNCDLNPIEHAWKDMKHEVKKRNKNLSVTELRTVTLDVMRSYSTDIWKKHWENIKHVQEKYWADDSWSENAPKQIAPIVIPIGGDCDEEEEDVEEDAFEGMPVLYEQANGMDNIEPEGDYDIPTLDFCGEEVNLEDAYEEAAEAMRLTYLMFHGDMELMSSEHQFRNPNVVRRLNPESEENTSESVMALDEDTADSSK